MCILHPPITDKTTLIEALEKADIGEIQVYEEVLDGSQITSYIRRSGDLGNVRHSVIVLTKKTKNKNGR